MPIRVCGTYTGAGLCPGFGDQALRAPYAIGGNLSSISEGRGFWQIQPHDSENQALPTNPRSCFVLSAGTIS